MNAEDVDHRVREVVGRIVSEFSPSMVLLFGSRARGEARPDSDVDLIVVWKDENPPHRRSATVRLALGRIGFPMDLAVVTPNEFARLKEWRGHVFHSAAREGVVLHAA
jgi:predicted nucleotidyltransferase